MERDTVAAALHRIERAVEQIRGYVGGDEGAAVLDGLVDVSGVWQGKVMEQDTYDVALQLHQVGASLSGSILTYYDQDEPYFALQQAAGTIEGDRVRVFGTAVTFMPPDPDSDYSLDVFEMTLAANGREMTGRWTDEDDDADGRIVVRRPLEA